MHRVQVKDKTALIWELTEAEIRSAYPLPPSVNPKPTSQGDPFDKLPPDLQKVRLWLDVHLWEHWGKSGDGGPEGLLSWRKEFRTEFDSTDAGKQPPLGSLPVDVISSEPASPESARRSRDKAGPRLDYLSSNSMRIPLRAAAMRYIFTSQIVSSRAFFRPSELPATEADFIPN